MVGAALIIDHDRKFIFVHVPKTGGQSISAVLGGKTPEVPTHAPLYAYDDPQYFRFGFVRNPWDRMVSLYHFLCQKKFKQTDNFRQDEVRAAGFKNWLTGHEFFMKEDYLSAGECWVVGGKDKDNMLPMQQRSQMFWLNGCDFIGRVENLDADFRKACEMAGIKAKPLPHINKTRHDEYRQYYDDRAGEWVAWYFRDEIIKFGYEF